MSVVQKQAEVKASPPIFVFSLTPSPGWHPFPVAHFPSVKTLWRYLHRNMRCAQLTVRVGQHKLIFVTLIPKHSTLNHNILFLALKSHAISYYRTHLASSPFALCSFLCYLVSMHHKRAHRGQRVTCGSQFSPSIMRSCCRKSYNQ